MKDSSRDRVCVKMYLRLIGQGLSKGDAVKRVGQAIYRCERRVRQILRGNLKSDSGKRQG